MMQTSKESLKSADGKKLFYLRKESGSSVKNCEIWQFLRGYMEILENRPQLLLSRRYGQTTLPYYLLSIAAERHPSATDTCVAARFRVAAGAATIAAERRGLRSGFSCRYFEALVVLSGLWCSLSDPNTASLHHLNMEQLTKTLASLFNLYEANRNSIHVHENAAEFHSLYVLLHLGSYSQPMNKGQSKSLATVMAVTASQQKDRMD
ncbi:hypothetical protein JHK85_043986 [Glycine max]|nr:hypothetical protein JHK85_043986 [Glycine max]